MSTEKTIPLLNRGAAPILLKDKRVLLPNAKKALEVSESEAKSLLMYPQVIDASKLVDHEPPSKELERLRGENKRQKSEIEGLKKDLKAAHDKIAELEKPKADAGAEAPKADAKTPEKPKK